MKTASTQHKHLAESLPPIQFAIVTVSDTRTIETDENGKYLKDKLHQKGHQLIAYYIIPDEPAEVESVLSKINETNASIILFNGGTGISQRDNTFDALNRRIEKEMIGFGELFRMLSYQQIGSAAMFSRATAGVWHKRMIFSVPGSPAAVELAWEMLIEPELKHILYEITR
jgi:molybdenum cofactor biosynthesis protein B